MLIQIDVKSYKLKVNSKIFGGHGQNCEWPLSQCSNIGCTSRINRWNKRFFLHHDTNSGKLEVTIIIFGWAWSFKLLGSKMCFSRMN